jgi:hypothetical protein
MNQSATAAAQPTDLHVGADVALSEMELAALEFLAQHGGCVLVTAIEDKNGRGVFGEKVAGMRVYQKLDRRGLVLLTEEPIDENGFQFTPMAETTDAGRAALAHNRKKGR